MNRFEKIQSMSIEQMADKIMEDENSDFSDFFCKGDCLDDGECRGERDCIIKWLMEETESEKMDDVKIYDGRLDDGDSRAKRIARIADHYGEGNQLNKAQEECGELIRAIKKFRMDRRFDILSRNAYNAVCEEIADVSIMLDQLVYLLDVDEETEMMIDEKIARQEARIRKECEGGECEGGECETEQ